jgi:hypothetical protein
VQTPRGERGAFAPRLVTHCTFVFSTYELIRCKDDRSVIKQAVIAEKSRNLDCLPIAAESERLLSGSAVTVY